MKSSIRRSGRFALAFFTVIAMVLALAPLAGAEHIPDTGELPDTCDKFENQTLSVGSKITIDGAVVELTGLTLDDDNEVRGFSWSISGSTDGKSFDFAVKTGGGSFEEFDVALSGTWTLPTDHQQAISHITFCVFDEPTGTITIVKDAQPDSDQAFSFSGDLGTFSLTDDGEGTDNQQSFTVGLGDFDVTEDGEEGWTLTDIECQTSGEAEATDEGSTASISINADGDSVTCTFTNTQDGQIVVVKDIAQGSDQEATFDFTGDVTATLGDDDSASESVAPGTYTVTETVPEGWQTPTIDCDDDDSTSEGAIATYLVAAGETVTCTFTNAETPPDQGTIIVEKQTLPDGSNQSFTFSGEISATLTDGQTEQKSVDPGTYTVSETVPDGWELTDISCDDGESGTASSGDLGTGTATFEVEEGETVTCTFTNTQDGEIVVVKDIAEGSDQEATFDFTGDVTATLGDDDSASESVAPGTYTVTETVPEGWQTPAIDCDDDDSTSEGATATYVVAAGETATCTFTNAEVTQPAPLTVNIVKDNDANEDGTFTNQETATVPPEVTGLVADVDFQVTITNTSDVPVTITDLTDSFNSTEIDLLAEGCSDIDLQLGSGDSVTCTFTVTDYVPLQDASTTNTAAVTVVDEEQREASDEDDSIVDFVKVEADEITLSVVKTNDADGDGTFSDSETVRVTGSDAPLAADVTFQAVITNTGTRSVVLTAISDAFGSTTIAVCDSLIGTVLDPGESVICTFTVDDYGPASGLTQVNTVTVSARDETVPENTATSQDLSTVNFTRVLQTQETTTTPATLPFTGGDGSTGRLGALAAALVALGGLVLALSRGERRRRLH